MNFFLCRNCDGSTGWLFSFLNADEFDWQVTGVVGRAELLSSIFYLWALMMYAKSIRKDRPTGMSLLVT